MTRLFALLWLVAVVIAGGYLAYRVHEGLAFRTDLLALLPREEQNPVLQKADDAVTQALSRKLVLLVGDADRAEARAAATELTQRLQASGVAAITTSGFDPDHLRQMGQLYFPYRRGLLSEDDRRLLQAGKGEEIATRALSRVYGFVGTADPRLIKSDPFLLLQSFFTGLPLPLSKLTLDDGMLSVTNGGMVWVLVAAQLTGEPYALDTQKRLTTTLDIDGLTAQQPGLQVLRLGAVFFAQTGAEEALNETSTIGLLSTLGTILLVLVAYRAVVPLVSSVLVIGVGIGVALAASLAIFGNLHVGALLFGVSLIGVAVDYSLQYSTEAFAGLATPAERLRRVFKGICMGTATTVIGYLTLLLAPFPGLHQIATFSAVGLVAAWITVVLWLPRIDRVRAPRHGAKPLAWAGAALSFWEAPRWHRVRRGIMVVAGLVVVIGLTQVHADDEVRHLQATSADLIAQQDRIQHLIGSSAGNQFFLIQAKDDESALRTEEALADRLGPLVAKGALAGFQLPAAYIPSAARQLDNRHLIAQQLDPLLPKQLDQLGLTETPPTADDAAPALTLNQALGANGPLAFLSSLVLEPGLHVATLDGIAKLDEVAAAADGLEGVRFVDPAGQFSALLGKYRIRALELLALSAALMAPLLARGYGIKGAFWIMTPPLLAVALALAIRALAGGTFTFFDAMGLVLVLSIGVDYAVFCAGTSGDRKPVTMLAVALAACTALMSFGLLALSRVTAVHAFGATMLTGIVLAFVFAPMARWGARAS
ncbi:MAG TPA: hypothetical protein VGG27_20555 [Magnetospirillaceae bacterium]|jgi:predicted exporter